MPGQYKSYYDSRSALFNEIRLDQDEDIQKTLDAFVKQVPLATHSGPVLDVGCGTGRYSSRLARLGYSMIGMDISDRQLSQVPAGIQVVCADAARIPLRNACCDSCLMILVLQQIPKEDRLRALNEACRILVRSGVLVIKTSSHADLRRRQFGQFFPSALSVNLARYPDCPVLFELLRKCGFKAIVNFEIQTHRNITVPELLRSIEEKHNTTLALIPKSEFNMGIELMRKALQKSTDIQIRHYHTMVLAKKD